jgi:cyclic-di-AMP phosphodiesterase PgpH
MMDRPAVVRFAIFLATVVAAWGILSLGTAAGQPEPEVGELAPQRYEAQRSAPVVDSVETERLRQEARDSVPPEQRVHPEIEAEVISQINTVFDDVEALVVADAPQTSPPPPLAEPAPTTSTTQPAAEGETTTTTTIPLPAQISGVLFLDVDGDRLFNPAADGSRVDRGLERVTVQVSGGGDVQTVTTGPDGAWSVQVEAGPAVITIDSADPEIPDGFVVDTDNLSQTLTCDAGAECLAEDIGFQVNLRPAQDVTAQITSTYSLLSGDTANVLAATAADDVVRAALGEPLHFPALRQAALQRVLQEFGTRVTPEQVFDAKARQRSSPPLVFHTDSGQDILGGEAAGEIVAIFLQANFLVDETLTEDKRTSAAEGVEEVVVEYTAGQLIVDLGAPISQLHLDALRETGAVVDPVQAQGGLLAVVAVLAGLLGLYLSRFRREFWARPRMVALLGILMVLAAGAVRVTAALEPQTSWYVLPAAAFGFMTAVLFDSRIAILLALAVGVLAAVGTRDVGVAVYAVLATMAPIPFVSSVSSRRDFRNAVVLSGLTAAVAAAATSWFFHAGPTDIPREILGLTVDIPAGVIGESVAWAFGVSVIASLVGLASLQFFEAGFDITTTLSLLDLTDRNHAALQLLQEEAFGTFNHSLMVGTLAHAAARAIGANALLARATAYYHDLGKTENPLFFIENQFGIANPHDQLRPSDSAEVIRRHVTDGIALARKFKIPTDVATGIVSHHGDGIMRYFYEKARVESGEDANPDDFRHIGHKPRTAETAIVMLSDSLEAACRAVFQTEEPTAEAIEKVVDRVIDEKLNDGQLRDSPLTLGELTKIRQAFLESLVGHYHQRIAYPNFPGQ